MEYLRSGFEQDNRSETSGETPENERSPVLTQRVFSALQMLLEAYNYAEDLGADVWEFAVELASLRKLGLTNNDCRWLVGKALVAHARETTLAGESQRTFQFPQLVVFGAGTSFVLTDLGVTFARQALRDVEDCETSSTSITLGVGRAAAVLDSAESQLTPVWDRDRQQLRVGDVIVKQFKVPAPNQETILAAFEEEEWPPRIDDPLSPAPEQEPKRRLHDTINSLNRNQKRSLIRFLGDGSGQGIRWEFTDNADPSVD